VCVPGYLVPVAVEWTADDAAALASQEWRESVRRACVWVAVLTVGAALSGLMALMGGW
jgi:hypothetical protein